MSQPFYSYLFYSLGLSLSAAAELAPTYKAYDRLARFPQRIVAHYLYELILNRVQEQSIKLNTEAYSQLVGSVCTAFASEMESKTLHDFLFLVYNFHRDELSKNVPIHRGDLERLAKASELETDAGFQSCLEQLISLETQEKRKEIKVPDLFGRKWTN